LETHKKTYLAKVINGRVMDPAKAPSSEKAIGQGNSIET